MEHNSCLCPKFESAFTLLSKKWTGLIIKSLLEESKRFREIADIIPNMSASYVIRAFKGIGKRRHCSS